MPLLIRRGRVITAEGDARADIFCQGETISRIEPSIEPESLPLSPAELEVVDASGKYVFPGFVDPHVHIHLPVMGTLAVDDYASASRAALVGGTTTLIEMICPTAADQPLDAFETWHGKAQGLAAVDYSFHMGVVRFQTDIRSQFRAVVERGIPSFKIFLAYKGLDLSDDDLFAVLRMAKELGVIVTAHCENAEAIDVLQRALVTEGKLGTEWHAWSHPPVIEADGVHHLCTFAELTGAHVYAVHTSCDLALREAVAARQRGVQVWIEAVVPHLVLDATFAERPAFEGAKYVMAPPLRAKWNQEALWQGLANRDISTVATDHAPFNFRGQKDRGRDAFPNIPNGIPTLQERIDLVHTVGVCEGRLSLCGMVDACSTQAARLFGLFPRKGTIEVGCDADLVVYDPSYRGTFSHATSFSNVDYNPYEGWERKGRASVVTVRGQIQVRDGEFVGTLGRGQFIPREPTHF